MTDDSTGGPYGIILFGANGSGKTTLGRELARILRVKHMDHEDYCFEKSEIPYTVERSREECIKLMLADIEKHKRFVLSAVTGDFGDRVSQLYTLAVHLSAPLDLRIKRIEQRQKERFGERIQKGGDMYARHLQFVDFVSARSLSKTRQWARTLACPLMEIDSTEDWRIGAARIAAYINDKERHGN